MKTHKKSEYAEFQMRMTLRFCGNTLLSVVAVVLLYVMFWKQRMGDWIVWLLEQFANLNHEQAFLLYHEYFRGYKEIFFAVAIVLIFSVLLLRLFRWMTQYFREIHQGIDALLAAGDTPIQLSPEMAPFTSKLNAVKDALKAQRQETALAEQRKDELVMYLAHDIRTPLTSVIGYLNLLDEEPNMLPEQRARNVHITLEKAYRLEEMVNEFFEITRYDAQQIKLKKVSIDLYYMLAQLSDELSPVLAARGNTVRLAVNEDAAVYADPDKLARVFGNILKNAAAYSYPNTAIVISATKEDGQLAVSFQNEGDTIPQEQLSMMFDKFCRLDQSRGSDTGGTGLGLAIAREIVTLHGGSISAASESNKVNFTVWLPQEVTGAKKD